LFLGSLSARFYRLRFSTERAVSSRAFAAACVWPDGTGLDPRRTHEWRDSNHESRFN
jgi:hypothetical protein